MDVNEYRKSVEQRLAKARENLKEIQDSNIRGTTTWGHELAKDARPMLLANAERIVRNYEETLTIIDGGGGVVVGNG